MISNLPARLRLWFWSIYGRYVWDEHRVPPSQVEHMSSLLAHTIRTRPAHVLDVGCGTGTYALALAQQGFRVTGIDGAAGMLEHAYPKQALAPSAQLRFQRINLDMAFPLPDRQFDAAIAISVLQAVAKPACTLREMRRVLKPRGVLVVLHWPKPPYRALSLRQEVRQRTAQLRRKTARNVALITIKSWAERAGGTRYWTVDELQTLLETEHFQIQSIVAGPPIIAVACTP